ncbi:MAG: hypothetical protein HYR55_18115 [Acidobacteria bacterium]|nr:hypothetical protein [Acidobacteriota bacterium]
MRILDRHREDLLAIRGVRDVLIVRLRGRHYFNVITSRSAQYRKIPKQLEGVPVFTLVSVYGRSRAADKAFEQAKALRRRHVAELSIIPGVEEVVILITDRGEFVFKALISKEADPEKLPKTLEGIPLRFAVRPSPVLLPRDNPWAILERHEAEIIDIPGVQKFGWRTVDRKGFCFYVAINETTDPRQIPKDIEGTPVQVSVWKTPPAYPVDKEYENLKAIQARHEPELFRNPNVYAVGIEKKDGKLVFEVHAKKDELKYLPTQIEGVVVVSCATEPIRPL